MESRKADIEAKVLAGAPTPGSMVSQRSTGPNVRVLVRRWEAQLEKPGAFRFNPLQAEGSVHVEEDSGGLVAECKETSSSCQGVKALPTVRRGRYQFEVELLCDCQVVVGWSGAMSPAASFQDSQAYGYSSHGERIHEVEAEAYGRPYGKAGDIIGVLLSWSSDDDVVISFALNGKAMGVAFEIAKTVVPPVPLQPHICQPASCPPMRVRLRGAAEGPPLAFRMEGFASLADVAESDFCPFSKAVAFAASERTAASLTEDQIRGFCVPDAHIIELYDLAEGASDAKLLAAVGKQLGLPGFAAQHGMFHVCRTGTSTCLAAFCWDLHAAQLVAPDGPEGTFLARPLAKATAASRERLREVRGETYRPQADPSAARRLIHGSLQMQMPLAHVISEKQRRPGASVAKAH